MTIYQLLKSKPEKAAVFSSNRPFNIYHVWEKSGSIRNYIDEKQKKWCKLSRTCLRSPRDQNCRRYYAKLGHNRGRTPGPFLTSEKCLKTRNKWPLLSCYCSWSWWPLPWGSTSTMPGDNRGNDSKHEKLKKIFIEENWEKIWWCFL